jgi:hypothetical protein
LADKIEDPLLERVLRGDTLSQSPTLTRNCNTAVNDGLYRNLLGRCLGGKIEDPLLEVLDGGCGLRGQPFALPTWTRNYYLAANEGLYRDLPGRCLGDKIEDPLLEGLAGGRGLRGQPLRLSQLGKKLQGFISLVNLTGYDLN